LAETAYQTQYRQEFIHGFEDRQSRLRSTVVTETVIKGNKAVFLVADSGSATAASRGVNGLIPARADNLTQNTATLQEWHDLVRKTGFNVFASQGDQKRIMQETSMAVINRKIDDDIIAILDTMTNDTGTSAIATLDMIAKSKTILGDNFVNIEEEDNMFGLISPGMDAYLMQVPEYASADYVSTQPFSGPARLFRRWYGVNWIVHPRLSGSVGAGGAGTTEKAYMYHRNSVGHAVDKETMQSPVGYDEEQDYSWARCTVFMGSVKLQNAGAVQMKHDASAYAAS
tara:strand:- start:634 stop:1488 length:855 start_codon:yes stop_codon:yes gene_type:complete